jgi:ABC-type transport system involved in multi-copper enzyme maturation permease subunit
MTLLTVLCLILVVFLAFCIIGWLPVPKNAPPYTRNVLYILLALVCIFWLLSFSGILSSGGRLR